MEHVKDNEIVQVAMTIIMHAGDARIHMKEALRMAKEFDFEGANSEADAARECIRLAHQAQTEVIQNEARGIVYDSSLLFTHAQDTLMTIMSEASLADELIDVLKIIQIKCSK